MRKTALRILMSLWTLSAGAAFAQMAPIPPPPSLAPPPDRFDRNDRMDRNDRNDRNINNQQAPVVNPLTTPETTSPGPADTDNHPAVPLTAATLTSMEALNDKLPLHVGDQISFRVIEDRDAAVTRVVTDTGEVDFPYVGRIKVLDKTCHQVAVELKRLLEIDYYKQATVIVGLDIIYDNGGKEKKRDLVWIIGEVRSEGPQELSKVQPLTVSQVILRSGGFGIYADQRKVRLIHKSTLTPAAAGTPPNLADPKAGQIIDVKSIFEGHQGNDPVVLPDDYIIVPKRILNI